MSKIVPRFALLCVAFLTASGVYANAPETISLDLPSGTSVDIRQFQSQGDRLLLGFACDEGSGKAEVRTASALSDLDLEIWMPDLLSAHFLPKVKSSLDAIPSADIAALIDAAVAKSDKQIYLISSGRGAAVLMRGLAEWEQSTEKTEAISGVILLFPRLTVGEPEPGKAPEYIDSVGRTHAPLVILEGERTPNRWALPALKERIEANGSRVVADLIPGVRGFFYERDNANLHEKIVTRQLAGLVRGALARLDTMDK